MNHIIEERDAEIVELRAVIAKLNGKLKAAQKQVQSNFDAATAAQKAAAEMRQWIRIHHEGQHNIKECSLCHALSVQAGDGFASPQEYNKLKKDYAAALAFIEALSTDHMARIDAAEWVRNHKDAVKNTEINHHPDYDRAH